MVYFFLRVNFDSPTKKKEGSKKVQNMVCDVFGQFSHDILLGIEKHAHDVSSIGTYDVGLNIEKGKKN